MFKQILIGSALVFLTACTDGKEDKPKNPSPSKPVASKPKPSKPKPKPEVTSPSNATFSVSGDGKIEGSKDCAPRIGNGGNYVEGKTRLAGKCEKGGVSPKIASEGNNRFLIFNTSGAEGGGNDRSELAYTPMMPFDQTHNLSFRFRIPKDAPVHRSGQMFYPLQFWQCSTLSPIAGMRIVQGTSHEVDFMTRSQNSSSPVIGRQKLVPGQWYSMDVTLKPSLSSNGLMQVKIDGKEVANFKGSYGADPKRCSVSNPQWRVKFGIYKSNNPGPKYEIHYDDFKMVKN
jgi:hypothetical protein